MYRVWYGNGQVSETYKTRAEAIRHLELQDEFARLQRALNDGDGIEWAWAAMPTLAGDR